jgi:spore coat polysaccharide biosynthesis predicted glycosyltransferase SpsG
MGWGHAVRSAALAAAFRRLGISTRILTRAADPALVQQLEDSGEVVEVLTQDLDEIEGTVAAIQAAGARMLVLDSYALGQAFLEGVHEATGVTRTVIDDLADRDLPCEALLNPNPFAGQLDLARFAASLQLLGTGYALLRQGFAPENRPGRELDPANPRVLVTLGGGPLGARTVDLASALDALDQPLSLDLLLGSGAAGVSAAREFAASAHHEVRLHVDRPDVERLLAQTTMAISAAGTTCFELAACGVPALLLVAVPNQRRGAAAWHALGACEYLGGIDGITPATVAAKAAELLRDPDRLTTMSARGTALVTGDGASRAAEALIEAFALRGS